MALPRGDDADDQRSWRHPVGPAELNEVAQAYGVPKKKLLVLGPNNDPFNVGTPAHRRDAEWFADVFHTYEFPHGVHIRRIHYALLGHDLVLPSGRPYTNTEGCDDWLYEASKKARILGLVDAEDFEDRRNPPPLLYTATRDLPLDPPSFDLNEFAMAGWRLEGIGPQELNTPWLTVPDLLVSGYDYHFSDQPIRVEVWCEKSTMNDVFKPLARLLGFDLQTGKGFMSITNIVELLRRAETHDRTTLLLYVSDFDPAGQKMAQAVARQIQFWRQKLGVTQRVILDRIMLTEEQVRQYQLPRTPIKAHDNRKAAFETRFGEGAVELDSLEAGYPGVLARLITDTVKACRDTALQDRLRECEQQIESEVEANWADATVEHETELEALRGQVGDTYDRYQARLTQLAKEMDDELALPREQLANLARQIRELSASVVRPIDLPQRPEGTATEPDRDVIYDTERDWLEQLAAFKRHQGDAEPDASSGIGS